MLSPPPGATRLAFDTILWRGMGGSNEVCVDGPIEGVTSGMPGLKMIVSYSELLHEKTNTLSWAASTCHFSTMYFSNYFLQFYPLSLIRVQVELL